MTALPTLRADIELHPPWLQPIDLPPAAYKQFASRMSASLDELERRFAPPARRRPVGPNLSQVRRDASTQP